MTDNSPPTLLPPDPDGMNDDRADWAANALRTFQELTGADHGDAVCDLLCDLMHLCDRDDLGSFGVQLLRARRHYEAETAGAGSV